MGSVIHHLGASVSVTEEEAIKAGLTVYKTGLRRFGVKEIAELTDEQREQFLGDVTQALKTLGIYEILTTWRETSE